MKKAAGIVVIVSGLAALGSGVVGGYVEDNYQQQIDNISSAAQVEVVDSQFEKGWFSSSVKTSFKLLLGQSALSEILFVVDTEIIHGPVIFSLDRPALGLAYANSRLSFIGLSDAQTAVLEKMFDGTPVSIQTLTNFDNTINSVITLSAFDIEKDGVSFSFGGLSADVTGDLLMNHSEGSISLKAIKISGDNIEVNIAESNGQFEFEKYNDYIQLGDYQYTMPGIEFSVGGNDVSLRNVMFSGDTGINEEKINTVFNWGVEAITASVPVTSFSHSVSVNNISIDGAEQAQKLMQEIQLLSSDPKSLSDKKSTEQLNQKLRELLPLFLQKGVAMDQLINISAFDGEVLLDLDVEYIGLAGDQNPMDVSDSLLWLDAFNVDLQLKVDEVIVQSTAAKMMAPAYVEQGFVKKEGKQYIVEARLLSGELTINDKLIPIKAMLSAKMAQQSAVTVQEVPESEEM